MYWSVEAGFLHSGMRYMATDIKGMLRDAKLPERTIVLCLNQDLNSALEDKERQLIEALAGPDMASLNGAAHPELRADIAAIKDSMGDSNVEFKFRALPRHAYALMVKHFPPKEGDVVDEANGFDWDEVTDALLRQCLGGVRPVTSTEWTKLDDEDWATLLGNGTDEFPGVLSSIQFDSLAATVWRVNRRDVDVPFLPSNSPSREKSEAL